MSRRAAAALVIGLVAAACGGSGEGGPEVAAAPETSTTTIAPIVEAAVESATEPALPVTVTSADGREVTVDDISRILPLRGNISEIVFDLGLGDRVVGRDVTATFPGAKDLPLVTRAHDVSAESVLSLRPTLVLIDVDTGPPEAIEQIRNVGIPVVTFDTPTEVADVGPRIEAVGAALGMAEAGRELAADTLADIERLGAVDAADEEPVVAFLYFRGAAGVYLIGGPASGADSMIDAAGGIDAGTLMGLDDSFTPITSESMAQAAPDVILMTTTGLDSVGGIDGLVEIPGIAQTPAGADRRVATLEDGLLYSFGSRTPEAIEALAAQFHADGDGSDQP